MTLEPVSAAPNLPGPELPGEGPGDDDALVQFASDLRRVLAEQPGTA
jgi:hypothetical protein